MTPQEIAQALDDLRQRADQAFQAVARAHPSQMGCGRGCHDCCHALYDLGPAEAWSLAGAFARLNRPVRRAALKRADKAAAVFDQALRDAQGLPPEEAQAIFSAARPACPLLEDGRCLLYAQRPLTCRLYGAPLALGGQSRSCPRAGFTPGQPYSTIHLEPVHQELARLDAAIRAQFPWLPARRLDVARALQIRLEKSVE